MGAKSSKHEWFNILIHLPDDIRAQKLARLAESDSQLAEEVQELLEAAEDGTAVPPEVVAMGDMVASAAEDNSDFPQGTKIGSYVITRVLGSGGFGTVYEAERNTPVRKTVAIKILHGRFDRKEVFKRFDRERQTVAAMNHPNIAAFLDAGTTDNGRPFFVMEHVPGVPITQFADNERLSIKQRLELFCQVCEAVTYSHRNGIIHRDIKAANVLAFRNKDSGASIVKVIDFGIAKAKTPDLTNMAVTAAGERVFGTYATMSPEQADCRPDIDTSTDVYSLGVLLYELLTGELPFDQKKLESSGLAEIRRIILEVDPPAPSTKLSDMKAADRAKSAKARDLSEKEHRRCLRRELELIPLYAIRKERSRRYESVLQFQEDIKNYLACKALVAGPDSKWYRLTKFCRLYRIPIAIVSTIVLILVLGLVSTLYVLGIVREQERIAVEQRKTLEAVRRFVQADIFGRATPDSIPNLQIRNEIADKMLAPAAESARTKFAAYPVIEAAVEFEIAEAFAQIGRLDQAEKLYKRSLELRRKHLGNDDLETIQSMSGYSLLLKTLGRIDVALVLSKEAYENRVRRTGEDDVETIILRNNYAECLLEDQKAAIALPILEDCVARIHRVAGARDSNSPLIENNFAKALFAVGKHDEALAKWRSVLTDYTDWFGADHPHTLTVRSNYANAVLVAGLPEEAKAIAIDVLSKRRLLLGDDHSDTMTSIDMLGVIATELGDFVLAKQSFDEVLERRTRVLGEAHPSTRSTMSNFAGLHVREKQPAKAVTMLQKLVDLREKGQLPESREFVRVERDLAIAITMSSPQRLSEMCDRLKSTRTKMITLFGEDDPDTVDSTEVLGRTLDILNRSAEADPLFQDALNRRRKKAIGSIDCLIATSNLGNRYNSQRRFAEAEPLFREALEGFKLKLGELHPKTMISMNNLASNLNRQGRTTEAEPLSAKALQLALNDPTLGANSELTKAFATTHAAVLDHAGKPEEARKLRLEFHLQEPRQLPSTQP